MALTRHLPSKRLARRTEILFALVVVTSQALFWTIPADSAWTSQEIVMYGIELSYWGAPVLLALTAVLSSAVDGIGVGSALTVGGALATLYIVGISIYTLVNPPEGGGVFFGHILTTLVVIPFVALVLLRRMLNRLFARLWLRVRRDLLAI